MDKSFFRFVTLHAFNGQRDGRTDRQTDRRRDTFLSLERVCILQRGKNSLCPQTAEEPYLRCNAVFARNCRGSVRDMSPQSRILMITLSYCHFMLVRPYSLRTNRGVMILPPQPTSLPPPLLYVYRLRYM